jgi:hypothetical protein
MDDLCLKCYDRAGECFIKHTFIKASESLSEILDIDRVRFGITKCAWYTNATEFVAELNHLDYIDSNTKINYITGENYPPAG